MTERLEPVDRATLRDIFEQEGIEDDLKDGVAYAIEMSSNTPRFSDLPPGTISQISAVWRGGERVAIVHWYRAPDGGLAAGRRPDPKAVLSGGIVYVLAGWRGVHAP